MENQLGWCEDCKFYNPTFDPDIGLCSQLTTFPGMYNNPKSIDTLLLYIIYLYTWRNKMT
jgi:hypothetical protein